MPTPDPNILDEKQLTDLEFRPSRFRRLENRHEVGLTPDERDALCATVRALRAENEKWQRAAGHWKARHEVVESRLAQVEQERNSWRRTSERLETEKQALLARLAQVEKL